MKLSVLVEGRKECFEIEEDNGSIVLKGADGEHRIVLDHFKRSIRSAKVDNKKLTFGWRRNGGKYEIQIEGIPYEITVTDSRYEHLHKLPEKSAKPNNGTCSVTAPIPGLITAIKVKPGDKVKKDQSLVTLDAMKLQNDIFAPRDGKIAEINVKINDTVDKGTVLIVLERVL